MFISYVLYLLLIIVAALFSLFVVLSTKKNLNKKSQKKLAFFHPFCNDGGGGERVLWCIIQALLKQKQYDNKDNLTNIPQICVYSLQKDFSVISTKVKNIFNIDISQYSEQIKIIHVPGRYLLTPTSKFTMLCHIFLPMLYCIKCLWKYQPDIFYDTTGFAYNFFVVKSLLPGTKCHCYIHYPFISNDMVNKIKSRKIDFNNNSEYNITYKLVSASQLGRQVSRQNITKAVGIIADEVQTNSTWTYNHIRELFGSKKAINKLYPPCAIDNIGQINKDYSQNNIISLAQFRPEKNHLLQIRTIAKIIQKSKEQFGQEFSKSIQLNLCGSTRGKDDQQLLQGLKKKVQQFKLEENVKFCVNMKFPDLMNKFKECQLGIHTMEAEHFGISIVQMLAYGCIVVAHNSAGPKYDIIKNELYLAQTDSEYQQKLYNLITKTKEQKSKIAKEFQTKVQEFGQKNFRKNFRQIYYKSKNKIN